MTTPKDPTRIVSKPAPARDSASNLRIAQLGKALAAPLAVCDDPNEALTVTAMLAVDVALAAGVDGAVYARVFETMWKDRMALKPEERMVQFRVPDPGPVIHNAGGKRIQ